MPNKMYWKSRLPLGFLLLALFWIVYSILLRQHDRRTPAALQQIVNQLAGPNAINCGRSVYSGNTLQDEKEFFKVHACSVKAFKEKKTFSVFFEHDKFGFFNMMFGLVDCDYVIYIPSGEFKLIRWTQKGERITQNSVIWSMQSLNNVHVTTWGYPGYEPILHYKDDQF
jgi:hypothetical protein